MSATLVRVINGQRLPRSILLDKIDRTSGQFEDGITYALQPKQKVYVPYTNPLDPTVAGYIDLVPSDEVLLQLNLPHGVIFKLASSPPGPGTKYVSFFTHSGALTATPVVTASVHGAATGQTGTHGQFAAAVGPIANFTDATASAFAGTDGGKFITVSGSTHTTNNGTFLIASNTSATVDVIDNAAAVVDASAIDVWSIFTGTTITGTTFLSLTPDHTYVTLTNLTGSKQVLTDTAILAAGGTIGATSIVIPTPIITIGAPAAGWLVQVQANSKKSNTFTMT
jgi:hypothetical protein